jgi:hypothetical protein
MNSSSLSPAQTGQQSGPKAVRRWLEGGQKVIPESTPDLLLPHPSVRTRAWTENKTTTSPNYARVFVATGPNYTSACYRFGGEVAAEAFDASPAWSLALHRDWRVAATKKEKKSGA